MFILLKALICFLISFAITPYIKKLAIKIGATDKPSKRKVHEKIMPRLGGLGIFISFLVGVLIVNPTSNYHIWIISGAAIIVVLGILDDIYELSAKIKLVGQTAAAVVVSVFGGIQMEFINLPFGGVLEFGIFSVPMTIFWIVAITNAINLIDGLDGLAAGVTSIALFTVATMAYMMGNMYVLAFSLILLFSVLGFLYYNFYPAKIFLGDTGSLFLGFMIAVLSLLGFKNITLVSLFIPLLILGVPIIDTLFAIIRRRQNRVPFYIPDRSHIHHCLLDRGFTHRSAVLIIYLVSSVFGLAAILFSMATIWGAIFITLVVFLLIELLVEYLGLINKNYKPLLKFFKITKTNEQKRYVYKENK
ncbi:undecaprenyl/decaprenyl-phosphate alpha-N-acetylglucosaminyl 1-phosphate transferase [Anaerobacillus sp. CMMVII]|uniref:glycosyltransferase family 4 protein n=1 Tax=Anaerobacillus sp. CMMVII TaxID=2755588 RepID=UPI0021B814C2|nr:MraY family glycosyltransferase [Anaerobacillus sp. CMMVII]MCT8140335.1 undecaprenyl/decaprenyl-phosphate alpha-N-acetylglucosaminyl 1-phosphate transferase [Anaerobacillus sp. CMMVII]